MVLAVTRGLRLNLNLGLVGLVIVQVIVNGIMHPGSAVPHAAGEVVRVVVAVDRDHGRGIHGRDEERLVLGMVGAKHPSDQVRRVFLALTMVLSVVERGRRGKPDV